MFTAGKTNLKHHTPEQMRDYFRRVEPDSLVNLPDASITGR